MKCAIHLLTQFVLARIVKVGRDFRAVPHSLVRVIGAIVENETYESVVRDRVIAYKVHRERFVHKEGRVGLFAVQEEVDVGRSVRW